MMKFQKYLFLLIPSLFLGQGRSEKIKKIDSLLSISNNLSYGHSAQSIRIAQQSIKLAREENYYQGIAEGYNIIAYTLFYLRMLKESYYYAEKGEEYVYNNDYVQQADVKSIIGNIYMELGLYGKAEKEFRKKLFWSNKIQDENTKSKKIYSTYFQLGLFHESNGSLDSSNHYYKKCLLLSYSVSGIQNNHSDVYTGIGLNFMKKKRLDSAEFYINKAFIELRNSNGPIEDHPLYAMGMLKLEKRQYEKALYFFFEAVSEKKKINPHADVSYLYQSIAKAYSGMHDVEKEKEYLVRSIKQKDSIETERNKSVQYVMNHLLNSEHQDNENRKHNFFLMGIISFILISVAACILYKMVRNDKNIKEEELLKQKQIVAIKEAEAKEMQKKINESFEEVVLLAKENHPEFFTRFQEVYPKFVGRLLLLSPDLKASELTFCAFLFLNFSTKDIAEFTFTSSRTVQTRKYHIRKKFNIPAGTDTYIWIQSIVSSDQ
ncbi:tetratricopeptide repeat protein [Chryseobacterium lathyri]|uniref:HTH luxR-type domain-containing protein n=1 Tax=Chryseobacterium lathyri TaxID=395933 RepID=A0A511YFQ5_9FLAO|nr:hypothetical protein [Chryseobacterium lathyri]GEN74034.1 hypothetical protein CLA01_41060 [Chryseobacterium lathyri]